MNEKLKDLEDKYIEEEEKEQESDAGSNKNPYDTPFLRALNETRG